MAKRRNLKKEKAERNKAYARKFRKKRPSDFFRADASITVETKNKRLKSQEKQMIRREFALNSLLN